MAVTDHLLAAGFVLEVGVVSDPGGDLGLDGLGEHLAGAVAEDLGEDVLAGGQGHDADVGGRLVHGGVLLGLVGRMVCLYWMHHQDTPPPFKLPYTTFGYTPVNRRKRRKQRQAKGAERLGPKW